MEFCEAPCLTGVPGQTCAGRECLVEHAQRGCEEAREQLFSLLTPVVRRQAQRLCGNGGMAQDVAQAALVLVLEHLSELRHPNRLGAWVRRIVVNACRMEKRSQAARAHREEPRGDKATAPDSGEERLDARRQLRQVLRAAPQLPPLLEETFRLRVVEGLTTRQAATLLGVSPEAIRARLSRARRRLRAPESGGR